MRWVKVEGGIEEMSRVGDCSGWDGGGEGWKIRWVGEEVQGRMGTVLIGVGVEVELL